ncbi:MAG: hypothetical protein E7353_06940 [Clostridiales bacterium]|nr:hypothetical protein [Clostridiales bacterium]
MNYNILSTYLTPHLSSFTDILVNYGGLFIVMGAFIVIITVLSIIYGQVKKKRGQTKQKRGRRMKVLPDVKKILGFNPYEEVKTQDASGDFYALASSAASVEDALELKNKQKAITEEKINAILAEKKEAEERKNTCNDVISALKNELANEKSKGRKKSKNRIADIDSEIKNNLANISDYEAEVEFCINKISICNDALEHLSMQIRTLEVTMADKRETLNSTENKNGATYESVKLYEKGMRLVKEYPKIKEPLLTYIKSRLNMEKLMKRYNTLASDINLSKNEVRQMTTMLTQSKSSSSDLSKKINQKNKEIVENNEKITVLKENIEVARKEVEVTRNSAMAVVSELGITKENFTYAQDSLIALHKYEATGSKLDGDIAKSKARLTVLQKEYAVEHKNYEKINKKDIERKTESSRKVSDLLNKISETKKEIYRIESFKEEYPKMSPAAFFRGSDFSDILSDGKSLRKNAYHAEIEKIKNEYVETVKQSFGVSKEETQAKQQQLLLRLEELEKKIYAEKTVLRTRAITRQFEDEYGIVNQRKIKIAEELEIYKNEIRNIDSTYGAKEYIAKLRRFSSTLSEEDLSDPKIVGMIKKCLEDAKLAGEIAQSSWKASY